MNMCAAKAKTDKSKDYIAANSIESFTGRKRVRRSFGRIDEVARMPNLIELQRDSYERFQQKDIHADSRASSFKLAFNFFLSLIHI